MNLSSRCILLLPLLLKSCGATKDGALGSWTRFGFDSSVKAVFVYDPLNKLRSMGENETENHIFTRQSASGQTRMRCAQTKNKQTLVWENHNASHKSTFNVDVNHLGRGYCRFNGSIIVKACTLFGTVNGVQLLSLEDVILLSGKSGLRFLSGLGSKSYLPAELLELIMKFCFEFGVNGGHRKELPEHLKFNMIKALAPESGEEYWVQVLQEMWKVIQKAKLANQTKPQTPAPRGIFRFRRLRGQKKKD